MLLAAGTALTPFAGNEFALLLTIGVLTAAGAGAGSFSVLIGVVAQRVPAAKRSFASGFVNAGGSLGQFVFAPLNQLLIASFGWMAAMWTMAVAALATIPLARPLLARRSAGRRAQPRHAGGPAASALSMREQLRHRRARPQLLVPARGVLHLRLSHRVSRHAPARRSEAVQPARLGGRELAGHHRPRQRRGQPHRPAGPVASCA